MTKKTPSKRPSRTQEALTLLSAALIIACFIAAYAVFG